MKVSRRVLTTSAIGVIMLGTAGVAVASIPSSDGVIHGCYAKPGLPVLSPPTGTLRVIDSPSQNCTANEIPLTWNQTGPQGPAGPAGKLLQQAQINFHDSVPGNSEKISISTCPDGFIMTGGGYHLDGSGLSVESNGPNGNIAWTVHVQNPTPSAVSFTVEVVCLKFG